MNPISFITANYVAREIGFNMTEGWMQGDNATNAAFSPIETYAERFGKLIADIKALGFETVDIWTGHLHWRWASDEHIAIAKRVLAENGMTVTSYAGGFGENAEEFAKACRTAAAIGATILAGSTPLLHADRAATIRLLKEHGVKLGIENHPAEKTPADVLAQIGDGGDGTIGTAVDTGWWGTHGYDAARAIEELGPHIFAVHLKDVRAAGGHETCVYGQGSVPIEECVRVLQRQGYTGVLGVEHEPDHFDPTDDCRVMLGMVREWLKQ